MDPDDDDHDDLRRVGVVGARSVVSGEVTGSIPVRAAILDHRWRTQLCTASSYRAGAGAHG